MESSVTCIEPWRICIVTKVFYQMTLIILKYQFEDSLAVHVKFQKEFRTGVAVHRPVLSELYCTSDEEAIH
jgi:hypothetical protein